MIPYTGTTNSTPKRPLLRTTLPGLIRVYSALVFLFIFKLADKTLCNRHLRFQTEFPGEEDARFSNERQRGEKAALPSSPHFTAETGRWRQPRGGANCGSRAPPRGTQAPGSPPASAGFQRLFFLFFHLFSFYFFPQGSRR